MNTFSHNTPGNHLPLIGFIGLGAMGAPMVRHLLSVGYPVLVCDANRVAVQTAAERGARVARTPKDVASEAGLVFTCLPSLDAVRQVVLGDDGVKEGKAVRTFVDFSTTGASFARELAEELHGAQVMMLDSPITGNVTTAGNGTLGIMCSGPEAAYRQAEPVLQQLAGVMVLYLGEQTGKAQSLKLMNNLLSATGMAASSEAFILGVKAGLGAYRMLEIINAGDASSSATRNKFARAIFPRRFDFGARMAITAKDITLSIDEAQERGVPMWIGQSVQQIWTFAVSQGGHDKDGTALITYLEPWAGVEVSAEPETTCEVLLDEPSECGAFVALCFPQDIDGLSARLQERGFCVTETDLSTGSLPTAVDFGSRHSSSDEGGASPRCILVSINDAMLQDRTLGLVTQFAPPGCTFINMCPLSSPHAAALHRLMADNGHALLHALHTGTKKQIKAGDGNVIAGGEAESVRCGLPFLRAISRRVFHLSVDPAAAHIMHSINFSLFATLMAATCESFVSGAKAGLDPLTMTKILGIETGKNAASARIIPEQVATRTFDYGMEIGAVSRSLRLAAEEAARLGVTPWILDKTRLLYGLAVRLGHASDDVSRLMMQYEKWACIEVISPLNNDMTKQTSLSSGSKK